METFRTRSIDSARARQGAFTGCLPKKQEPAEVTQAIAA
jgi:hypothetical protein